MLVSITGVNCKPEVVEYLNSIATPRENIPEYWHKDTGIDELFSIAEKIETLGMFSVITKTFNLKEGTKIPVMHLFTKE